MSREDHALLIGTDRIPCEIHRSNRRQTVAIQVYHDQRVVVRAPARADAAFIADCLARRSRWIRRTLERIRANTRPSPPVLRYQPGEAHDYLGRRYELQVRRSHRAGVDQDGRSLRVSLRGEPTPARIRRALEAWYRERLLAASAVIIARHFEFFRRRGHPLPVVATRRMRTRWGSLAGRRRMNLNLALIRMPVECLEYVVVHELCHLEHGGHGAGFYRLMDQLLPDWRTRRQQLECTWLEPASIG